MGVFPDCLYDLGFAGPHGFVARNPIAQWFISNSHGILAESDFCHTMQSCFGGADNVQFVGGMNTRGPPRASIGAMAQAHCTQALLPNTGARLTRSLRSLEGGRAEPNRLFS